MEMMIPCVVTYRIYAEDEETAIKLCDTTNHKELKPLMNRRIKLKATVYEMGRSLIKLVKVFRA